MIFWEKLFRISLFQKRIYILSVTELVPDPRIWVRIRIKMKLIQIIAFKVRCLMIPFLVLTMFDIILAGSGGIVVVVALFFSDIIPGRVTDWRIKVT